MNLINNGRKNLQTESKKNSKQKKLKMKWVDDKLRILLNFINAADHKVSTALLLG